MYKKLYSTLAQGQTEGVGVVGTPVLFFCFVAILCYLNMEKGLSLRFKDVRAHCLCASLLRTLFTSQCHATSWHRARALSNKYLTIILRNRAGYRLILSRRGRRPSWLNQGIFRKIEQDNCFIIQQNLIDFIFRRRQTIALG